MALDLLPSAILLLAAAAFLFAAGSDAAHYRIPNSACLALLSLFPCFVLTSATPISWQGHGVVFALFFAIGYFLYLGKLAGAGDVKLLSVAALWAGPAHWAELVVVTALSGGVLSLGLLTVASLRHKLGASDQAYAGARTPVPYGMAIALGGLCVLFLLSPARLPANVLGG